MQFSQFFTFGKMALLNPCMKINLFLAKSILLKHYESVINKKIPEYVPESAKSTIKVSLSTKRGFSKKALTGFEKLFLFWVRMNPSNAWKGKLKVASFFAIQSPRQTV